MIRAVSLAKPFTRRAVPAAFSQRVTTFTSAPKNWMERLLSAPKGWEKYYRKPTGGSKAETTEASGTKAGPKAEKKVGGSGGGGGKQPELDFKAKAGLAAIIAGFLVLVGDQNSGK